MEILKNIEMFPGIGTESNVYLVDGELLMDAGSGIFFDVLKTKLESSFDTAMIGRILNTHAHFDNIGADKKFRDWLGCEIFMHKDDIESAESGEVLANYFRAGSKCITIDNSLKNGDVIKTENYRFEVFSTPGHTPGSVCLYDKKSRVLFSGDTVFDEFTGRTDLPKGSTEQLKSSLKVLSEYPVKYLLPGHGQAKIDGISFMLKRLAHAERPTKFV